ncbi:NAD(P)/FAD-dependent oxidoreductase [Achromobacter sp. GG226]|nr:FAD-dependent oxidoreductase [Verticiella sp. GG226]MBU4612956.1 NAD(P)/FAD-dependent oxidoreductase [Verticiella sp. GG226]
MPAPSRPRLVVIGNGMAGVRVLEELVARVPDLYAITVFGAEPVPGYNRVLLSPVLTGEQDLADIVLQPSAWYAQQGIRLRLGCTATRIDRVRREVHADDGSVTPYDRLVLATGGEPVTLTVPGHDLDGVQTFRSVGDVERLVAASQAAATAVVIGGGLLGLEAAMGLAMRGMQVSVVHRGQTLLDRQLDAQAAELLRTQLQARGLALLLGRETDALLDDGQGAVAGVRFQDGTEVEARLVVMAVGVRPNTRLASDAGLQVDRGILVSDTLQTYDPRIYAIGECVNHRGQVYGLAAPAQEQARVAADHLARVGIGRYRGSLTAATLKVTGIDVFSAGEFDGGDDDETIVMTDAQSGLYKKLVIRDDRLVGACLYGDTADGAWYRRLIDSGLALPALREDLMFGDTAGQEGVTP